MKLIGFSGSLRKASINTSLLKAAKSLMPDGIELEIIKIDAIPLYNGDMEESQGIPNAVQEIKDKIAAADGLIICSPEYNNSIPGVLKNALDWLTRPAEDINRVFGDKPIAIVGASPSGFGTINAQTAWLPILRFLKMRPYFRNHLTISQAFRVFDNDGELQDPEIRDKLKGHLRDFCEFIKEKPPAAP